MPVVGPDLRNPGDWLRLPGAVGVIRDGERLRLRFQSRKGGGESATVSVSAGFPDGGVREQLSARLESGWLVVAGLPPSRCVVRTLESPLDDPRKSAEIWPSLLDAALPFPMEECQVGFLPPTPHPEGGLRCVAAAIRNADLLEVLAEWSELQLEPDFLVPEVLLLSEGRESRIWLGECRTVLTARVDGLLRGTGGAETLDLRAKTRARFEAAWRGGAESEISWSEVGPGASDDPDHLETAAARFPLSSSTTALNLRGGDPEIASPRVVRRKAGRLKRIAAAGLAAALLAGAGPLILRARLRHLQDRVREAISGEYEAFTGSPANAPGQEVLLARRFAEESLGDLRAAGREMTGPRITRRLLRVFLELKRAGIVATRIEAEDGVLRAHVLADEETLTRARAGLERQGTRVKASPGAAGDWILEVGAP